MGRKTSQRMNKRDPPCTRGRSHSKAYGEQWRRFNLRRVGQGLTLPAAAPVAACCSKRGDDAVPFTRGSERVARRRKYRFPSHSTLLFSLVVSLFPSRNSSRFGAPGWGGHGALGAPDGCSGVCVCHIRPAHRGAPGDAQRVVPFNDSRTTRVGNTMRPETDAKVRRQVSTGSLAECGFPNFG